MVNDQDTSAPSVLPVPILVEVSVDNDSATTRVLPMWLHANYAWRTRAWLDHFDLTATNFDDPTPKNVDTR